MSKNIPLFIFLSVFVYAMTLAFAPNAWAQEAPAKVCIDLATAEGITDAQERRTFIISCAAQLRAANAPSGVATHQAVYQKEGPSINNRHYRERQAQPGPGFDKVILGTHDGFDVVDRGVDTFHRIKYGPFGAIFGGGGYGSFGVTRAGGFAGVRPGHPDSGRITRPNNTCAVRTKAIINGVHVTGPEQLRPCR